MAPTSTDILGAPYVARTLPLQPDSEGEVVATLVHRAAEGPPTGKAVLHVHGFADYFFQTPVADFWCRRGYDFYALDLRKHGRSLLPHQTPNYVESLATYHEELDQAYDAIRANYRHLVLSAHSTGGLTVPLWAAERKLDIDGMVLNAPWLDMQGDPVTRKLTVPVLRRLGARKPELEIPRKVDGFYGRSLHRDHGGEWDFNLAWKPLESWPIYAGWIRAIREGQIRISRGIEVPAPILVLSSSRSTQPNSIHHPDIHRTDIVLDVEQIRRRAPLLGRHVTLAQVDGALHDVTLSRPEVRKVVFHEMAVFLSAYVDG
ncbi:alpha/beta hydrolase [Nocardioides marmoriginsengisoli]|uniref:Alpha/beta hydrolase n=1 Tax=Nocardioides marmoriginsengisoli TaxID=661483 RepID=A0A3N0CQR4_9ACTN|nr:alpha/beta hydrolase [Nocardioides marmoriginsengisoli]RNL65798.1 alpha/beta hydrolase [Nocardioides marmoriginsengisoli]